MSLTVKQQRFVEEYLIDLNATQAAIRAGYSAKTAEVQGSRLLSYAKVAEAVKAAMEKRSSETAIDAAWVLKRLASEAEADIADIYTEGGDLKPVHEWPLIWRKGLVAGLETSAGDDGMIVHKVKLSDRTRRLELLGKHIDVGAFEEKFRHDAGADLANAIAQGNARVSNGGS